MSEKLFGSMEFCISDDARCPYCRRGAICFIQGKKVTLTCDWCGTTVTTWPPERETNTRGEGRRE